VTAPYDHEALWAKAKVFLNRAMDGSPERSPDEEALWAAAALELLGKAALARVSPLLIATPTEDGVNILIAAGLLEGDAKFASVSASTIFKRCQRAFRPFNAGEAQRFADARNEYLHGASMGFVLPAEAWWPRFWALASVLITAQDREIADLVGYERTSVVDQHLEQNTKNVEHRTEALIARARQRLAQYEAGTLPAKVQAQWNADPDLTLQMAYSTTHHCPACGGEGTLEGDEYTDAEYQYEDDDPEWPPTVWATLTIPSSYFSCPRCHLVLDYDLLAQADVAETFEVVDDDPPVEQEYGND
jgi:hypothetical protein